ncbi:MAG: hypothetical protein IMF26_07830 [Candidatus Fermentithermobacillus carboniphilus]|uniref:Uncharacterized protein n=1 Tax=Candidatus Fermentithermobacillus carboniphilus TaxID=3085328 RepID=A0AAT9LA84_9FIRM|nr:MAG: hypothetical protein IMF26_07830 [Candidatus Fermentithermobacillus carboniphilus]
MVVKRWVVCQIVKPTNCFLLAVAIGSINLAASVWIDDYSSGVHILLAVVVLHLARYRRGKRG